MFKKDNKNKNFYAVLSQDAINYIYEYGQPIANYQFVGYIFSTDAKGKMCGILDINGNWGVCSNRFDRKGKAKPLSERQINNQIKKWIKWGFLIQKESEDPFSEFEYYRNIKIDLDKIEYIDDKLFDNIE